MNDLVTRFFSFVLMSVCIFSSVLWAKNHPLDFPFVHVVQSLFFAVHYYCLDFVLGRRKIGRDFW